MKRPPTALTRPWAITPDWLRVVLSVWSRGEIFDDARIKALQERDGKPLENTRNTTVRDGVAVVPVYGPLFRHADIFSAISGGTSYAALRKDLQVAEDDSAVRVILLDVDSPGGEVDGIVEMGQAIRECSKPVYAYTGGMAASAAYWIASACREIICSQTAMLGSIGVRTALVDDSERDAKQGVRTIEIISSQSPGKRDQPIDDEIIAKAQAHADYLADIFIAAVAEHRGVTAETVVSDFGGGDVLIGQRAVDAGMADGVGDLESFIAELSQAAQGAAAATGIESAAVAKANRATHGETKMKISRKPKAESTPEPMPEGAASAESEGEPESESEAKMETCGHCKGSGEMADGSECETCGGTGEVPVHDGAEASADDGDHDEDDEGKPNEAASEDDGADAEEDEKKVEARSRRALARKLGLPATASTREVLAAANATSVSLTRMEAIVAERVSEKFEAEKKQQAKRDSQERANRLATEAIRGGYDERDRKALVQFAMINFDAAERSVSHQLQKGRQLYGSVTHAGSPGGADRAAGGADVSIKDLGGVKLVRHGMSLSSEAKAIAKRDSISYEAALDKVVREKPELYQSYLTNRFGI